MEHNHKFIGREGVYTTSVTEKQIEYVDYYPICVFAVIDALKKTKITKDNIGDFRKLFEAFPVCNNIAHVNNAALTRDNFINKFWHSNARIKTFLVLKDLNENHKIGFSHTQFLMLEMLCNCEFSAEPCKYDTKRFVDVNIVKNHNIMIVNLKQMKQMIEIIDQGNNNQKKNELNNFLNYIPVCCNFIISYERQEDRSMKCVLFSVIEQMTEAEYTGFVLTFNTCIEMSGITDECEIGLSEVQYDLFKNICNDH